VGGHGVSKCLCVDIMTNERGAICAIPFLLGLDIVMNI
jgi:hypothetical protein